MSDTIRIRVLHPGLPGHSVGDVVEVAVDSEGTPLEQFWRRRLKDAERDDCCEVVTPEALDEEPTAEWDEETQE